MCHKRKQIIKYYVQIINHIFRNNQVCIPKSTTYGKPSFMCNTTYVNNS